MYCITCRNCPKKIGRITGHNGTQQGPDDTIATILLSRIEGAKKMKDKI